MLPVLYIYVPTAPHQTLLECYGNKDYAISIHARVFEFNAEYM